MLILNSCFDDFGVWYSSLCFIITVIITILSSQLKESSNIKKPIKIIHIISCILTLILSASMLILWTTCKTQANSFLRTIIMFCRYLALIGVLAILSMRLYFTFKDSHLKISKCQQWLFMITCSVLTIWLIIEVAIWEFIRIGNWYSAIFTLAASGVIYFAISIYAMILFAQKMYKLIKMRSSIIDNGNRMKLNAQQEKILFITAKYVTLLAIAMISSWITMIFLITYSGLCGFGEYCSDTLFMVIQCTDSVINIICLYLQFPFAKNIYNKYCLCCRSCCLYMLTRRTFLMERENVEENIRL